MDPDVLVSHLDDFRDVLIKINDDLSHAKSQFERLKRMDVDEQAAFVDEHTRGLDATMAAMDALADDACAHFRRGHADAATGLEETEHALRRQASEVSVALLSQDGDLKQTRTALDNLREFTRAELRHQREVSEWTVRAAHDFLEDLREDKRKVAAETVGRVGRWHAGARTRRLARHRETFGALSAHIERSAETQGAKTLELREVIDRADRRLGIRRR
ncbi:predicted protein [Micromonas commoda]|uniref:Uncharacterized protein n=1 Tax=Micromonas commoda (strain RCC299 / NOUM17 / CCMP2709) TaxID=296587 RepID=C1EHI2_MICCC|nr:predicted protein [Micromonas commoda]ACO67300.1 predicted protein [Micromonas commoda]|eukprot:XP_002506042.1 predicted protein [Micromonas commoda]